MSFCDLDVTEYLAQRISDVPLVPIKDCYHRDWEDVPQLAVRYRCSHCGIGVMARPLDFDKATTP